MPLPVNRKLGPEQYTPELPCEKGHFTLAFCVLGDESWGPLSDTPIVHSHGDHQPGLAFCCSCWAKNTLKLSCESWVQSSVWVQSNG